MRIGIDCRMWSTTTGRYIREIVRKLTELDKENEYVLFFMDEDFDKVSFPKNFKKVKANVKWHTFAEQITLPLIFLKEKLDVLHIPHFNYPILYPKKFVITIHDLTLHRVNTGRASTRSYLFYQMKRLGFKIVMFFAVFRSKKILTVSKFVKNDIAEIYGVKKDKIVLAPNGVSAHFRRYSKDEVSRVLPKYKIKKPFLFYLGNAHPHKNVEGLLQAYEIVSQKRPDLNFVLGGDKYFFYERLEEEWKDSDLYQKLNFTGFIDDDDLPIVYSGAEALVNPSLYEGFGLQVLEAFSCGVKVICSNTTSLPEVGGDGAYYFDPRDKKDMAKVILETLDDRGLEKEELGYKQIKKYSWEKSAKIILDLYKTI